MDPEELARALAERSGVLPFGIALPPRDHSVAPQQLVFHPRKEELDRRYDIDKLCRRESVILIVFELDQKVVPLVWATRT